MCEEERIIMVSFCGSKPPEEPYSPPEVVPGDINSYIKNRLDDQITWYDKRLNRPSAPINGCSYWVDRCYSHSAACQLYSQLPAIAFVVGLLGGIITVIEGTERLGRYHENWVEYRSACEMLKHEKNLYLMDAYPYGTDETKEQLFVHNIENLLSSEGNKWKVSNIKAASPKEKTHSETGS